MKKNVFLIPVVLFLIFLTGCSSLPGYQKLNHEPLSENSTLVYGYLQMDTDRKYQVELSCPPWDGIKNNYENLTKEDREAYYESLLTYPGAFLDKKTGVFAIQINEPGAYWLCDVSITPQVSYGNVITYLHYNIQTPENKNLALQVMGGEMIYWGATVFTLDNDTMEATFEPHATMTKADVLDLVEEMLSGKGWDMWIEEERSRL